MIIESILATIILLGGLYTSLIFYKTIKCPFGIFTVVWNGLFFLCTLNIVNYEPISNKAIFIIFFSYIIFLIGSLLERVFIRHKTKILIIKNKDIRLIKLGISIAIFFSILGGILWLIQAIKTVGFVSIRNNDAYLLRYHLLPQINKVFSYFVYVPSLGGSILCGLLLSKYNIFEKKYILNLFGPTIVAFFIGQRNFVIICIFFFIAPLIINKNKIVFKNRIKQNKYVLRVIIVLIIFFAVIGNIRGSGTSSSYNENSVNRSVNHIYTYLTGSFVAFSEVLSNWDGELYYGVNTFTPMCKFTNAIGVTEYDTELIKKIENGRDPVYIPYLFNVYSYLWDIISDFGYIGLIIFELFLGYISSYLWNRFRANNCIIPSDVIFSFVLVYLLYAFIASITNYSMILYGFGYAFLFVLLSQRQELTH